MKKKIFFLNAYVGVELANETREVVVLEVLREQIASELSGTPNYEGRSVVVPGNEVINGRVIDQLVSLGEEWCGYRSLRVSGYGSGSWSWSGSRSGIAALFHR